MPATTLAGIIVKLKLLDEDFVAETGTRFHEALFDSALADAKRLAGAP